MLPGLTRSRVLRARAERASRSRASTRCAPSAPRMAACVGGRMHACLHARRCSAAPLACECRCACARAPAARARANVCVREIPALNYILAPWDALMHSHPLPPAAVSPPRPMHDRIFPTALAAGSSAQTHATTRAAPWSSRSSTGWHCVLAHGRMGRWHAPACARMAQTGSLLSSPLMPAWPTPQGRGGTVLCDAYPPVEPCLPLSAPAGIRLPLAAPYCKPHPRTAPAAAPASIQTTTATSAGAAGT